AAALRDVQADMATEPARGRAARWRRLIAVLVVIGCGPVLYDAVMMKLYAARHDLGAALSGSPDPGDGTRLYAMRQAYAWVDHALPRRAIVQPNPDAARDTVYRWPVDVFPGLYGHRQVLVADREYGPLFGIPLSMYHAAADPIDGVFRGTVGSIVEWCQRQTIDALVVTDHDPVWRQPDSWVWRYHAGFRNEHAAVFPCHGLRRHPIAVASAHANEVVDADR
ncbi:MAG TPA: hypothetical protein VFA38_09580, partial [Nitrospirales bacterium]|nr:hypothetical protein [Nitrospirales bacterium]